MKKNNRVTFLTIIVILAYLLSACSGVPAGTSVDNSSKSSQSQNNQAEDTTLTGTVEAINGNQVTVNGQVITVDSSLLAAANIAVGDNIKVEVQIAQDGSVTAVSAELVGADDTNANLNEDNQNNGNTNSNTSNSNDDLNNNSNGNDNSNSAAQEELTGTVEAITSDSITINGVVYKVADFTEFKDLIAMNDQVKIHVDVNADGTLVVREIEKSDSTSLDKSNSNNNGSDDNTNTNSNSNTNDDHGNDNGISGGDNNNGSNGGGNDNGGSGNGNGNG